MRFATIVALTIAMTNGAEALLFRGPGITSVAIDERDPNAIYLRIECSPCKAAFSTDGGATFHALDDRMIPKGLTTNLSSGTRRYVLCDKMRLLRSDDDGAKWTNTAAFAFLRDQSNLDIEREKKWFNEEYGARLPERSAIWHSLFGLFGGSYFVLTVIVLKKRGWLHAIWTGLRGVAILLLVWCLLGGLHAVVREWTDAQYPLAYWNTSSTKYPSPKLGVAMQIAALPLPLLMYLLTLWPILPGSLNIMAGCGPSVAQKRSRVALGLAIAAASVFIAFHLGMLFIGHFWE
jgi:hypothetical protein